jgi:3'-5' exoribonuclease
MNKLEIKTLQSDIKYEGILMIKSIELKQGKNKPYIQMVFTDGDLDLSGNLFQVEKLPNYKELQGKIVMAHIATQTYLGKFGCIVDGVDFDQSTHDSFSSQFIKFSCSQSYYEQCKKDLVEIIGSIQDKEIKKLCTYTFLEKYKSEFESYPAGKVMHHSGFGGLIEHSMSLAKLALSCADHYSYDYKLDKDMLIAGALFQDIGKLFEYDIDELNNTSYNKLMFMKGHITIGNEMLLKLLAELKIDSEQDKFCRLSHIILTHHNLLAYGSPVMPITPEAILIAKLDKMDSEMKCTFTGIKSTREGEDFTQRLVPLENVSVLMPGAKIFKALEVLAEASEEIVEKVAPLDSLF